jgi:hypothetical protein
MPRRIQHVLCHCPTCLASDPNGILFDQDRLFAHKAYIAAEKEATAQTPTESEDDLPVPDDDLPVSVASHVLAMTLTDEGPDIHGSNRLWTSRTDSQQNARLPDTFQAAILTIDDVISGVSRLSQGSVTTHLHSQLPVLSSAAHPDASPASMQRMYSVGLDDANLPTFPPCPADEQLANHLLGSHVPHAQRERNHLTEKNLTFLRRIENQMILLEDQASVVDVSTWGAEADRLQHALHSINRQAEVVQNEKQRLLTRLRVLRNTRAASHDPVLVEDSPVEYNTGERLVFDRFCSPLIQQ